MIDAICLEIEQRVNYLASKELSSIYFGGGTPSLLNEAELNQILETIQGRFTLADSCEITLEANPDDIDLERLGFWKQAGINRLSIGLQSFKESDLQWMNRAHSVGEALKCVDLARKSGITNISVDLIYGLPHLSMEEWKQHIETVLEMDVQHVSAYCLTIEEKTALHHLVESKKIVPAGEDDQSEQFIYLIDRLKQAGFYHYEISNFGLPGFEAVHNSSYWKGEQYLGVGPSAHSFDGKSRQWNVSNNTLYIKNLASGTYFELEELSPKDRWNELLLIGLRTSYGVNLEQLFAILEPNKDYVEKVSQFKQNEWLFEENGTLLLTSEGRLKADFIASELFV
ncbi:MAG: radical family heme chaperone HemW [Bacteroidota bacterium]|jgi:oxygen-independent coproporphyrinogen-3 oxidase